MVATRSCRTDVIAEFFARLRAEIGDPAVDIQEGYVQEDQVAEAVWLYDLDGQEEDAGNSAGTVHRDDVVTMRIRCRSAKGGSERIDAMVRAESFLNAVTKVANVDPFLLDDDGEPVIPGLRDLGVGDKKGPLSGPNPFDKSGYEAVAEVAIEFTVRIVEGG